MGVVRAEGDVAVASAAENVSSEHGRSFFNGPEGNQLDPPEALIVLLRGEHQQAKQAHGIGKILRVASDPRCARSQEPTPAVS